MKIRKNRWFSAKSAETCLLSLIALTAAFLLFYHSFLSQSPLWRVINRVGSDAQMVMRPVEGAENSIILQLINFSTLPRAKVLVNGQVKGDFTHPYMTVPVSEGDRIEVDTTFYDHPVTVKVLDSTRQVISPAMGAEFSGKKTVFTLGKVKLAGKS
ncbi:hypothetical protein [Desulforamulus putei]|uniref:Uncharacterized protein n=1 Tax=Desulforamulus putei DSM 12395 TaxID=1121429 RepID=A0A1M4YDW7_9FIRM|nr:hypothetical protein [Desulforamulus putei]SHF03925.1 hypothetical protein SAMN02745133_01692 [Desulforamulus putei DSM 12395]